MMRGSGAWGDKERIEQVGIENTTHVAVRTKQTGAWGDKEEINLENNNKYKINLDCVFYCNFIIIRSININKRL